MTVPGGYVNGNLPTALLFSTNLKNSPSASLGYGYIGSYDVTAGAGGAPDDFLIHNADFPRKCKLAMSFFNTTTTVGGKVVTIRDAAGGIGNAISGDHDAANTRQTALPGKATAVSSLASLWLRRGDSGIAGKLICIWLPSA